MVVRRYQCVLLMNKVAGLRVKGILSYLECWLEHSLRQIAYPDSGPRGKNNFGKATQSKFCRVEPTNRWQELNVLKKNNPVAVAVLASAWNPAKVRAPVNELQGAHSHPCPKELKGEELLQMTATPKVNMGTCPLSEVGERDSERKQRFLRLWSYFSAVANQLL